MADMLEMEKIQIDEQDYEIVDAKARQQIAGMSYDIEQVQEAARKAEEAADTAEQAAERAIEATEGVAEMAEEAKSTAELAQQTAELAQQSANQASQAASDAAIVAARAENKADSASARAEEAFQSASNGKTLIAGAITQKGVTTEATATFQVMADNILAIPTGGQGGDGEGNWTSRVRLTYVSFFQHFVNYPYVTTVPERNYLNVSSGEYFEPIIADYRIRASTASQFPEFTIGTRFSVGIFPSSQTSLRTNMTSIISSFSSSGASDYFPGIAVYSSSDFTIFYANTSGTWTKENITYEPTIDADKFYDYKIEGVNTDSGYKVRWYIKEADASNWTVLAERDSLKKTTDIYPLFGGACTSYYTNLYAFKATTDLSHSYLEIGGNKVWGYK